MLNRRDTLRGLALTVGAAATGWAGAAVATTALSWTPTSLTPEEAQILDVVAELIIPPTDTPGAREAGAPQFIDRAMANYCEKWEIDQLTAGFARMDSDAKAAHGKLFVALAPEQQVALLNVYDREAAGSTNGHFFPLLKDYVTVGYFTSELGATMALKYDPVPGAFNACVPLAEIGRGWATR
jgi:hypothetical protein